MESVNNVIRAIAWISTTLAILYDEGEMGTMGLEFSFKDDFNNDEISSKNDSSVGSSVINLTKDTSEARANPLQSVGRVFYTESIPLWTTALDNVRHRASFNTSFEFRIKFDSNDTSYSGDGMAFLMSGYNSFAPNNSHNESLGILDFSLNGNPSNHIIAVEFDTYKDSKFDDVDDNHVGIDVNSLISNTSRSLTDLNISLINGTNLVAWVDYDGNSMLLSIYVAFQSSSKPVDPFISQPIDLSDYLPQNIFIGFSAATWGLVEIHQILSWKFISTSLPTLAPTPIPTPAAATAPKDQPGKIFPVGAIVGIALALLFLTILLPIIFLFSRRKRNSHAKMKMEWNLGEADLADCAGPRRFTYKEIITATKNFSEQNFLGRGGFGPVYKGIMSNVGTPVAIKSIGQNSKQGEKEFMAEVRIISRIRHRNLLPLQGWCHEKGQLFIVYDYMPNGSLDQHIFKGDNAKNPLGWSQRHTIVCGLAAGLEYLHEGWEKQVIHRDVKSANVMLDEEFNAHLGDFGMARLVEHNQMPQTTMAVGTLGYLPPEVAETGKATSASDVYSFGAVALEVACGRSVLDYNAPVPSQIRLVEWVWELHSKGVLLEAADPWLEGNFVEEEMQRMLRLGLACSHPHPDSRPSMRQVHECLLYFDNPTPPISASKPLVCSNSFFQAQNPRNISKALSDTSTSMGSNNNTSATLSSPSSSSASTITRLLPR